MKVLRVGTLHNQLIGDGEAGSVWKGQWSVMSRYVASTLNMTPQKKSDMHHSCVTLSHIVGRCRTFSTH